VSDSKGRGRGPVRIILPVEIQASATGADMDLGTSDGSESRFSAFVERLVSMIGHADD
jgi:hypothetical protein